MKIVSIFDNTNAMDSHINCLNATEVSVAWSSRAIIITPTPVSTITQHRTVWFAYGWKRSNRAHVPTNSTQTKISIHR